MKQVSAAILKREEKPHVFWVSGFGDIHRGYLGRPHDPQERRLRGPQGLVVPIGAPLAGHGTFHLVCGGPQTLSRETVKKEKTMKFNWKAAGFILVLAASAADGAWAQVYTGTKIEKNGGLSSYHLSMGNYFNISEKEILDCSRKNKLEEELPVIFFMAQKADVAPGVIAGLRAGGMGWMGMARHFNLSPRIFYVPVAGEVSNTPYKKIYGYFQGNKSSIRLSDPDIVNLVNLKFMSNHYGHDPQEVIQMRSKGKTFPDIDDTFQREKEDMHWDPEAAPQEVLDSKDRQDLRKGDRNSLDPAERRQNR
jgi:hypothetical protein